jgi:hypothetical protein
MDVHKFRTPGFKIVVRGLPDFNCDKAKAMQKILDLYRVKVMTAIDKQGRKENLPDNFQVREFPSERKAVGEIVCEGIFRF